MYLPPATLNVGVSTCKNTVFSPEVCFVLEIELLISTSSSYQEEQYRYFKCSCALKFVIVLSCCYSFLCRRQDR